jgi:hypothetical protein
VIGAMPIGREANIMCYTFGQLGSGTENPTGGNNDEESSGHAACRFSGFLAWHDGICRHEF